MLHRQLLDIPGSSTALFSPTYNPYPITLTLLKYPYPNPNPNPCRKTKTVRKIEELFRLSRTSFSRSFRVFLITSPHSGPGTPCTTRSRQPPGTGPTFFCFRIITVYDSPPLSAGVLTTRRTLIGRPRVDKGILSFASNFAF